MIIRKNTLAAIDFGGLAILDYTQGLDTQSSVAEITVPQGAKHPWSWSRVSDKYYIVLASAVRFTIDGEEASLSAGDCCIIPKGHRFSYENPGGESARILLVHTPAFNLDNEVFESE